MQMHNTHILTTHMKTSIADSINGTRARVQSQITPPTTTTTTNSTQQTSKQTSTHTHTHIFIVQDLK